MSDVPWSRHCETTLCGIEPSITITFHKVMLENTCRKQQGKRFVLNPVIGTVDKAEFNYHRLSLSDEC